MSSKALATSRMRSATQLLFVIATLSTVASATQTTFHLIVPPGGQSPSVAVVIGSSNVALNASNPAIPHYTGTADLPEGAKYMYSMNGMTEPFERTLTNGRMETYNDVFNRSVTVQELPPFPWPLQDEGIEVAQWQRSAPRDPLFDDSYIPTLIFAGKESTSDAVSVVTPLYIILKDQILELPNAQVRRYKGDSWKLAYTFNFTDDASKIRGRNQFKLRTGEFDPTQLREKTYTDIMNALGVPVAQQVHVRVYENDQPLGLYILTDLAATIPESQRNFGFTQFEKGDPSNLQRVGVALDCGTGATFEYNSDNPDDYDSCYGEDHLRSDPHMVQLAKTLAAVGSNDSASQDAFERIFEVDIFLRQMVMEYLTLNWDGYWSQSSNFVMYYDEFGSGKWYFSDQDFDQTFGNGNNPADNPPASYKAYPAPGKSVPPGGRPLIEKLLAVPKWRSRFEHILVEVVRRTFNPVAFNRRIDVFAQIIRPEVQWDHSFREDTGRHYYFDDFDRGMTEGLTYRTPGANGGTEWGLKTFVESRASGVAQEFNFVWDTTPRDIVRSPTNAGLPTSSNPSTQMAADMQGEAATVPENISPWLGFGTFLAVANALAAS